MQNKVENIEKINEYILNYLNYLKIEKGLSKNTLCAYQKDVTSFFEFLEENKEDFSLDENRLIYGRDKMYEEPVFDSFGSLIGYDLYIE